MHSSAACILRRVFPHALLGSNRAQRDCNQSHKLLITTHRVVIFQKVTALVSTYFEEEYIVAAVLASQLQCARQLKWSLLNDSTSVLSISHSLAELHLPDMAAYTCFRPASISFFFLTLFSSVLQLVARFTVLPSQKAFAAPASQTLPPLLYLQLSTTIPAKTGGRG